MENFQLSDKVFEFNFKAEICDYTITIWKKYEAQYWFWSVYTPGGKYSKICGTADSQLVSYEKSLDFIRKDIKFKQRQKIMIYTKAGN